MTYRYFGIVQFIRETQPPVLYFKPQPHFHPFPPFLPNLCSPISISLSLCPYFYLAATPLLNHRPFLPLRSVLRVGMIGRIADVLPHLLQNPHRLVLRVEERLSVTIQRVLLLVETERQTEHHVQCRRVVVVTSRVAVLGLLVQLTAIRLSTWN